MKNNNELLENSIASIYNYIDGVDIDSLSISFCEQFDEKSHIWNHERHKHDYLEFIYFLDGRALIDVPGKKVNFPLNDLIAYPPGVSHQEFLDMHFHQEIVCIGVNFNSKNQMDTSFELSDQNGRLRWLFVQIFDEYKTKKEYSESLIKAYLSSVFLLIKRYYKSAENDTVDIVNRCIRYIHGHFSENINMKKLAAVAYVSPSYLTRVFQTRLGVSPIHYLINYRIETAKQLLRSSDVTITEIAEFAGFNDQKYFGKIFRKYMDVCPRYYRKAFSTPMEF